MYDVPENMTIFDRLSLYHTRPDGRSKMFLVSSLFAVHCVLTAMGLLALLGAFFKYGNWGCAGDNPLFLALTFLIPTLFLILMVDKPVGWAVKFVTRGDVSYHNVIQAKVFGNVFAGKRVGLDTVDTFSRIITLYTIVGLPVSLLATALQFPVLMPYAISIGTVVGGFFGALLLARKVFDIARSLRQHVNDPDAHKKEKE